MKDLREELTEAVIELPDTTCELLVKLFKELLQEQNK